MLAGYLGIRLYMLFGYFLPLLLQNKLIFTAIILFLAFFYIVIRIIYRNLNDVPPAGLYYFASSVMALFLVMVVLTVAFDILLLFARVLPSVDAYIHSHMAFVGVLYLAVVVAVYAAGIFNANNSAVSQYDIVLDKTLPQDIKIVMVSDIHVTSYTRKASMRKLVEKINGQDADVVVFVGDMIDGEQKPYEDKDIASIFKGIKSRYGVYGVLGNHEHYGEGIASALEVLSESGITMLREDVAVIDALNLAIIGRDDLGAPRFGFERKDMADLSSGLEERAVLVLDHQPQDAMKAKDGGADVQLSGHTHNGQIVP